MRCTEHNANLVRFGGAGAVLPFLFVVRRIWTLALLVNVLSLDVPVSVGEIITSLVFVHNIHQHKGGVAIIVPDADADSTWPWLPICAFLPINGVCPPPCNCFSTASVIDDSC